MYDPLLMQREESKREQSYFSQNEDGGRMMTTEGDLEDEENDMVFPLSGEELKYERKKSKAIVREDQELFSRISLRGGGVDTKVEMLKKQPSINR